jgi:putative protease
MKKKPELLAPAGNMAAVIAAINGKADAVYLGDKFFNARRNAENMSDEEITKAVSLCHEHGVKVYITLNILIRNSELKQLVERLNFYRQIRPDGLIVQDMGLIYLLRHYFPELGLQTSTQASVYGLAGTRFFEALGFDRVVLPREMPLSEVAAIKNETGVELKIFCHGALCYAYSGQCLMSSMIGGRSGNRGLCAQPCRKIYRLLDEKGQEIAQGYLMSPRDLNTLDDLSAIVASGVDSLKIEGRMKTPEYVYGITRAYREGLDEAAGEETEKTIDRQGVMQVFNREFTRGHLFDEGDLLNPQIGKNRGIPIGTVVALGSGSRSQKKRAYPHLGIRLDEKATLNVGDGLSFGTDGQTGTRVDSLFDRDERPLAKGMPGKTVAIPCRHPVPAGTPVYKNYDALLMADLKALGAQSLDRKKATVDFKVKLELGQPAYLEAWCGGLSAVYEASFMPETPQKNPIDEEMIRGQLGRTGGSGFELGVIDIEMEEPLFLSRSQLNLLRKEALIRLAEAIRKQENSRKPEPKAATVVPLDKLLEPGSERKAEEDKNQPTQVSLEFETMPDEAMLQLLSGSLPDQMVLPIFGAALKETAAFLKALGTAVLFKTPRVMDGAQTNRLERMLPALCNGELQQDGLLIGNYEALQVLKEKDLFLEADQSLNLFNTLGTLALAEWGVNSAVLSPELSEGEVREIAAHSPIKMVLPVFGAQELMISKKCLFHCLGCPEKKAGKSGRCRKEIRGSLVDERGGVFPVRRDEDGLIHVYNGAGLFLREEILGLKKVDTWRIYYRQENMATVTAVIDYYRHGIYENKRGLPLALTTTGTTRGSFKRGVN